MAQRGSNIINKNILKKLYPITLSVLIISFLTSCSWTQKLSQGAPMAEIFQAVKEDLFGTEEQNLTEVPALIFEPVSYPAIKQKYAFDQLENESMKTAYKALEESIYFISETAGTAAGTYQVKRTPIPDLNTLQIFKVKEAVIADHPEAFWINGKYTIGYNSRDGEYITMYSTSSPQETIKKANAFISAVDMILSQVPRELSEYERELFMHDKLIKHCEYSNEAADSPEDYPDAYSSYGALVNTKAVCGGYSAAMKLLLERVGIECRTISGMSKNIGHMWNTVKIDEKWYQLDVTWDDPSEKKEGIPVKYSYFNINDDMMKKDHEYGTPFSEVTDEMLSSGNAPDFYNFELPSCDSLEANFLIRNSMPLSELNNASRTRLTEKLADAVKNNDEMIYIDVESPLTVEEACEWLASGGNSAFNIAANRVNNKNYGRKIEKFSLFYESDINQIFKNIISIKIIYGNN